MRPRLCASFLAVAVTLSACGDESPDYEGRDYQAGADDGYSDGYYDALACVSEQGGRVEAAVDSCR